MMKKMNKKLLGSLILGLMLSAPVSQVNAIQLNGGGIYGASDSYGEYRIEVNGSFTYNFHGDSQLTITGDTVADPSKYGIYILGGQNPDVKNIMVADKLDISIIKHDSFGTLGGIIVSPFSVSDTTINRSDGGDITIESYNGGATLDGVNITAGSNNRVLIGDSNITLKAVDAKSDMTLHGLYVSNGSGNQIEMGNGKIDITGTMESGYSDSYPQGIGMMVFNDNTITTGDVSINVNLTNGQSTLENVNAGIDAEYGGKVYTGNGDITVHGTGGNAVYSNGIFTFEEGYIEKTGGHITAVAEGEGTLAARGVFTNGGTIDVGIADITAQTIGGSTDDGHTVESIGLYGYYGTINYAGGTITAVASDNDSLWMNVKAIDAWGAQINVNKETHNTVVINGDVQAADGGTVFLNMNTADSAVTGGFDTYRGDGTINLNLADGALWNATKYSEVSALSLDNGNIYINTKGSISTDINIGTYSGTGNLSFRVDGADEEGIAEINTGAFVIDEAEDNSFINVSVADNSINTLDLAKAEENLNTVAGGVFYNANDGKVKGKVTIQEGLITPEASGDLLFDNRDRGYVANMTRGSRMTKTMNAMKNLEAAAAIAWRQEDSTLSQRLGELRESTGGQGIWARMSRGEFEYDGEYKNQYNFFQLGYDWASGNWHYGVAVSHNDGETAYTYGSGENRSTSLSLYGTWLGDAGHYADIVLKQGRLSNDFDVYTSAGHTSGDYDAWGTSLSGEYGKKILLENDWYVTPQAQLTLMRIGGENYDTNNGIRVRQDTLYSAVGRLGFELGRKLDEKGSVYAKASVLHDFAGNAETYLSYNGFTNSYSQDLSDTWFEAGLGFNYRTGDNSYIYADVVRTFGGDVETPWQWNIGMRWSC